MKIRRNETGFLMVLDVGDEMIASLKKLADAERIGEASFTAIGAVRDTVLGYIDPEAKTYVRREFGPGSMELVSAIGNLARMDGESVVHCHIAIADREMHLYGGHLFQAVTSVTVEIFLRVYDGEITRRYDPDTGANTIRL
jgi:predicted DNA-binding protein with PD1-like motif